MTNSTSPTRSRSELVDYGVKKSPHAGHRARAMAIGERLETSPDSAPIWITEMVRRQGER